MIKLEVGEIYKLYNNYTEMTAFFKVISIKESFDGLVYFCETLYSSSAVDKHFSILHSHLTKNRRYLNITQSNIGEITLALLGKEE